MKRSNNAPAESGQSKFGRLGGSGAIGIVILAVCVVAISVIPGLRIADANGTLPKWVSTLALILLGASGAFLGALVWRARSTLRERKVKEKYGGIVFGSVRSKELEAAILNLRDGGVIDRLVELDVGLSPQASSSGFHVWAGSPQNPEELFAIGWSKIIEVVPSTTQELGRSSRGISLKVHGGKGEIVVPFVVTGAGFGNLFPLKQPQITSLIAEISVVQARASSSSS